MLEQIFAESYVVGQMAVRRFRENPLGPQIESYAAHLVALGYRRECVHIQIRLIGMLGHWLEKRSLAAADIDRKVLDKFLAGRLRGHKGAARLSDAPALARFHRYVTGERVGARIEARGRSDFDLLVADFEGYLRNERGLVRSTIVSHCWAMRKFLQHRFGRLPTQRRVLRSIRPKDVGAFFVDGEASKSSAGTIASGLRVFFRFLFLKSIIDIDLAASVPTVRCTRLASLPKFLPPEQIERVLRARDSETEMGRRDHAILMLLARLGLRGSEVRLMLLDDVDWRNGEVLVRGKGKHHERLPLPRDVGRAIADYVQRDRRSESRLLFVRIRAPRVGLSSIDEINRIVRRALLRASITTRPRGVSSHLFRHSLATSMLRRGASMTEIGQMLRHQTLQTTGVYARVDIDALRSLALPWPTHGGAR